MRPFRTLTKSEQVLAALRKSIRKSISSSETKLKSVRDLAASFSVSPQTIVQALDQLEKEKLIRREHGKGVFICPRSDATSTDVLLLAYSVTHPEKNTFLDNLMKIAQAPFRRPGINLTVRLLWDKDNSLSSEKFRYYVTRMIDNVHTDCLLINLPSLHEDDICFCMNLSIPVIFIGDFSAGVNMNMSFSQVTGSNRYLGYSTVRKLIEKTGQHEFVFYITRSKDCYFRSEWELGVEASAKDNDVKIHFVEFESEMITKEYEEKKALAFARLSEVIGNGFDNFPAVDSTIDNDFINILRESGIRQDIYAFDASEEANHIFFSTIYKHIETLRKNPAAHEKFCLELDYDIKCVVSRETL